MTLEHKAKAILAIFSALEDAMKDFINAATAPATSGRRLTVQWIGQNTIRIDDDYTNNDCGAACVAMLAGASVDEVSKATGKQPGYKSLSFDDLIAAAAKFGLHLQHASLAVDEVCAEIDRNRITFLRFTLR